MKIYYIIRILGVLIFTVPLLLKGFGVLPPTLPTIVIIINIILGLSLIFLADFLEKKYKKKINEVEEK